MLPATHYSELGHAVAVTVREDGRSLILLGAPGDSAGLVLTTKPLDPTNISTLQALGTDVRFWASSVAPRTGSPDARFGSSIAYDGTSGLAVVGSPHSDSGHGAQSGAASRLRSWTADADADADADAEASLPHVFNRELIGYDADPGDLFGSAVGLGTGGVAVVSAPGHRGKNTLATAAATGALYIFHPPAFEPPPVPPGVPPPQPPAAPSPPSFPSPLPPPATEDVALWVGIAVIIASSVLAIVAAASMLYIRLRGRAARIVANQAAEGAAEAEGAASDSKGWAPASSEELQLQGDIERIRAKLRALGADDLGLYPASCTLGADDLGLTAPARLGYGEDGLELRPKGVSNGAHAACFAPFASVTPGAVASLATEHSLRGHGEHCGPMALSVGSSLYGSGMLHQSSVGASLASLPSSPMYRSPAYGPQCWGSSGQPPVHCGHDHGEPSSMGFSMPHRSRLFGSSSMVGAGGLEGWASHQGLPGGGGMPLGSADGDGAAGPPPPASPPWATSASSPGGYRSRLFHKPTTLGLAGQWGCAATGTGDVATDGGGVAGGQFRRPPP